MKYEIITLQDAQVIGIPKEIAFNNPSGCSKFWGEYVERIVKPVNPHTPDCIFEARFCNFPKPVEWLFKLRNALMKPFGLQGGSGFRNLIAERSNDEIIICKNDSHLCFWVGIYCSQPEDGWQEASVTTVVKFNNFLGKLYFIGPGCRIACRMAAAQVGGGEP